MASVINTKLVAELGFESHFLQIDGLDFHLKKNKSHPLFPKSVDNGQPVE